MTRSSSSWNQLLEVPDIRLFRVCEVVEVFHFVKKSAPRFYNIGNGHILTQINFKGRRGFIPFFFFLLKL